MMTVAVILANCLAVMAIAEWGADHDLALLGVRSAKTACKSTLQRLFAKLHGAAVAMAVTAVFAPRARSDDDELEGGVIDGRAERDRRRLPGGGGPDLALTLLRLAGTKQIAATDRAHRRHPDHVVAVVVQLLPPRA